MKRMIVFAAVALCGALPVALQAEPASPKVAVASDAAKAKDVAKDAKAKDQPQPLAKPATPKKVPAASVKRWVDWQTGSLDARYRFVDTSAGKITSDSIQHKQAFKAGFKFDKAGRYSVQTLTGTGSSFTGSWDNLGPRMGDKTWTISLRQLYLQAQPVKGIEGTWGGMAIARGEHTEISSFDNDNFIMAGRVSVKRPKNVYFDEVSVTAGYLGDLPTPNVIKRFDRWDEHNYTQVLAAKKLGKNVSISADWTDLNQVATWRQAVRVATKEWMPIDAIRFENYQRTEGTTGYGFSVSAERAVHKRVLLAGGFANIDENNGTLSGDRYFRGKRFFVEPKITILPELNLSVFYTQAFDNDFAVVNQHRFDLVLSYNVLKALQKAGAW